MMNKQIVTFIFTGLVFSTTVYGYLDPQLCNSPNFRCVITNDNKRIVIPRKPERHQSYARTNKLEQKAKKIAPPVPSKISEGNIIKINLAQNIWAAYDEEGELVRSGPASGGRDYCPDTRGNCKTVTGTYTIFRKEGAECFSKQFPIGKGGAPMPYCMFFHEGYSLHGSSNVPDFNASHGCVRIVTEDAEWLNLDFVQLGKTRVNIQY